MDALRLTTFTASGTVNFIGLHAMFRRVLMKAAFVLFRPVALAFAFAALAPAANATDGVIEINHARALAGGVTSGDTAGYPVTISLPGSYRLTSNLTQPDANTVVIQIDADGVSLDLNGFAIIGSNTCTFNIGPPASVSCFNSGSGDGVAVAAAGTMGISIRNGALQGLGRNGIYGPTSNLRIDNLSVSHCGGVGIRLKNGIVSRTTISSNSGNGIQAIVGNLDASFLRDNGGSGISAQDGVFSRNTSLHNAGSGMTLGNGVVENSDISFNFDYGLIVSGPFTGNVVMRGNVFDGNNGGGTQTNTGLGFGLLSPGSTNACSGAAC
jgi:hypothetical protein